jgi:hypothetical protein
MDAETATGSPAGRRTGALLRSRMFSANLSKRRRWVPHQAIGLVMLGTLALVIAGWHFEPALALLTAQRAVGGNTFTTRSLVAPASLTAVPLGHDAKLTWPAGLNGNDYNVLGAANGGSNNCTAASFVSLASTAATSYTDVGRFTPQGTWFCYQVQTTYGSWNSTASNPTAAAQLGFVATSVQMINNGNHTACSGSGAQVFGQAGLLDCGDQLILTFNQAVNTASGPVASDTVCNRPSTNTIWFGSTTASGTCAAAEPADLGSLAGGTVTGNCRFSASYAWSNGNQTLTVTIGARVSGGVYPTVSTATWTFSPTTTAGKMQSATGAFHICDNNTGGGACLPATAAPSTF